MAVTGYRGRLEFDVSKANGTPRKLLDVSKINATWLAGRRSRCEAG